MQINKRRGRTCFKCHKQAIPADDSPGGPAGVAAVGRAISTGRGKPGDFFELVRHCGRTWAKNKGLKNYYVMKKRHR